MLNVSGGRTTSGWCGRVPAARAAQPFTLCFGGIMYLLKVALIGMMLTIISCSGGILAPDQVKERFEKNLSVKLSFDDEFIRGTVDGKRLADVGLKEPGIGLKSSSSMVVNGAEFGYFGTWTTDGNVKGDANVGSAGFRDRNGKATLRFKYSYEVFKDGELMFSGVKVSDELFFE